MLFFPIAFKSNWPPHGIQTLYIIHIYIYMIFFYDTIHASFVWFCIIPKLSTFLFPKNSGSFSWGKLNGNLSSKPFNLPNKQLGMKVAIRFRLWWRNHGKPCKWFKGSWVYVVPPYGTTKNYPAQNTRNLVDGYCSHLLLLFFVALFFFVGFCVLFFLGRLKTENEWEWSIAGSCDRCSGVKDQTVTHQPADGELLLYQNAPID